MERERAVCLPAASFESPTRKRWHQTLHSYFGIDFVHFEKNTFTRVMIPRPEVTSGWRIFPVSAQKWWFVEYTVRSTVSKVEIGLRLSVQMVKPKKMLSQMFALLKIIKRKIMVFFLFWEIFFQAKIHIYGRTGVWVSVQNFNLISSKLDFSHYES